MAVYKYLYITLLLALLLQQRKGRCFASEVEGGLVHACILKRVRFKVPKLMKVAIPDWLTWILMEATFNTTPHLAHEMCSSTCCG